MKIAEKIFQQEALRNGFSCIERTEELMHRKAKVVDYFKLTSIGRYIIRLIRLTINQVTSLSSKLPFAKKAMY